MRLVQRSAKAYRSCDWAFRIVRNYAWPADRIICWCWKNYGYYIGVLILSHFPIGGKT